MGYPVKAFIPMVVRGEQRPTGLLECVPGSPEYSFSGKEARAKMDWWAEWGENNTKIPQAVKDILGYSEARSANVPGFLPYTYIHRYIPMEQPNFKRANLEGDNNTSIRRRSSQRHATMYATSIERITGDVPGSRTGHTRDVEGTVWHNNARLTVTYSNLPFTVLTDSELMALTGDIYPNESSLLRYVSIVETPGGRTERVPSLAALRWVGDPKQSNGNPALVANTGVIDLTHTDVSITYWCVPIDGIPRSAMERCRGKTNVVSLGLDLGKHPYYDAKTLVYLSEKISEPYLMANMQMAVNIQYFMRHFLPSANALYRWDATTDINGLASLGPTYQLATRDGLETGHGLYDTADFNNLFHGLGQFF